ncbi:hypothetical protein [Massilibacteroides sp.]|uniref:hypothetical protein n=1 Tax=Massilibacteroides sp. TaxID=2034766 RepID=UPI0026399323|nr:hypothetical protein [Massilibacteroides sp.]MDD4514595.1 hypothetical protein [Massilibacteroides sp.]
MIIRKLLLLVSCFLLAANISAQLSKEDSLWIEGVKSGKIKIELNPETKRAIEEGRLIRSDKPNTQLLESSSELPILKEFTGIQPEEEDTEIIDLSSLPPGVFMLYDIPDSTQLKSLVYVSKNRDYISMKRISIGSKGFYVTAHTGDLSPEIKDGQSRGGALAGIGYAFSMEDILRYIFWPSERAKKRNRKYATAWKTY